MKKLALAALLLSACVGTVEPSGDTGGAPSGLAMGGNSTSGGTVAAPGGGPAESAPTDAPVRPGGVAVVAGRPLEWPLVCDPKRGSATAPRLRRLTAAQYGNTIKALTLSAPAALPSTPGTIFSTYVGGLGVTLYDFQTLLASAEAGAHAFVASAKQTTACLKGERPDRACIEPVVTGFGARAFRRPLTAEETERFVGLALANQASEGNDGALELAVATILSSPHFAFRWEVGAGAPDAGGRSMLSPYEIASAISYTLTDAPPDAILMAAAKSGELTNPDQVRAHVRRLLGPNADRPQALRFFQQYLGYWRAGTKVLYGGRPGVNWIPDADALIKLELSEHKSFVDKLFTDTRGFQNSLSTASSGITQSVQGEQVLEWPADQRAGMLTNPTFLISISDNGEPLPVQRGRWVREMFMCQPIPAIPLPSIPALPSTRGLNLRQKLEVHSSDPKCSACHRLMDPIGFALQMYGHFADYLPPDKRNGVELSGALLNADGADASFAFSGPVELAQKLGKSPVVQQCFLRQSFRYWIGRAENASDACAVKAAEDAYTESQGDAVAVFVALLGSDAFLYRRSTP